MGCKGSKVRILSHRPIFTKPAVFDAGFSFCNEIVANGELLAVLMRYELLHNQFLLVEQFRLLMI